ncbi:hypothetical protein [Croceibacterium ferulae]|uniref:hypothetical protein n=1 Tax=Croceibacterium ferulae TaxID=1854641 RepID=UPI000F86DC4A|nr:hypothetical protein [Croceibacterium ferulae]
MRFIVSLAAAALASITVPAIAAQDDAPQPTTRAERNQARLAERLEGRTAGEMVSCVYAPNSNRLETIEGVGFVYDRGNTLYVARPRDPSVLGPNDVVVVRRFSGGQLCRQDLMQTVDRQSGMLSGIVAIDGFVPYTKPGDN